MERNARHMINVLHFVRKNTQLKASFINNQISHHINCNPSIVYREQRLNPFDGGFATFNLNEYNYLDLSHGEFNLEKLRYKTVKTLSGRQVNQILSFIKNQKIAICHFHFGTDCGIFTPLIERLPIPSVVSFYGYDCSSFPNRFLGYGKIYLKHRVFKHITKVLAMSPDMKKDLMATGCMDDKIEIHYYGTDVHRFCQSEKQYPDKEMITILNLCSLDPQKGQLFLLKSIKKIVEKGVTNFQLRIVGTGEVEEELRTYVRKQKLTGYVDFIGAIPYGGSEMLREYHEADIFVHPSVVAPNGDKEGIPGTIVEAMSAGLPVISTWHAGIPYIITHNKSGILIKEHDVSSLADALQTLIQNSAMRKNIGQAGQCYAMENLDLKQKEVELENIYQKLIR